MAVASPIHGMQIVRASDPAPPKVGHPAPPKPGHPAPPKPRDSSPSKPEPSAPDAKKRSPSRPAKSRDQSKPRDLSKPRDSSKPRDPSKSPSRLSFPSRPVKGVLVECMICQYKISQKSIKNHFKRKHPDHDYEAQKRHHEEQRRLSMSPRITSPKKTKSAPATPLVVPKPVKVKVAEKPVFVVQDRAPSDKPVIVQPERPDVIVACVICYEMMSTKSLKGHFYRHHPDQDYQALKPRMSGASPVKTNNELITCSACRKKVSERTIKVHILKNHPQYEYKSTLKASREGITLPEPSPVDLLRAGIHPNFSEPRSRNETYPCTICHKEVVFQNMKKHFARIHADKMELYQELKDKRMSERGERLPRISRLSDPFPFASESSAYEVNNNAEEDYNPSALLKEIEEEMTKEYGMDPYSRILGEKNGFQVQVTEQTIRFESDDETGKFNEINPPSSKIVPMEAEGVSNLVGLGESSSESRKRKFDELDDDEDEEDPHQDIYKRLATENYMLERQILYLQEQEQFLERKMVAYQRIMEKKMQDFEEKLRTEFEEKSRNLMADIEIREVRMKEKLIEQEQWLARRLAEQRERVEGLSPSSDISALLPSPPTSDDKSDSSVKSSEPESAPLVVPNRGKSPVKPIAVSIVSPTRKEESKKSTPVAQKKAVPKPKKKKNSMNTNENKKSPVKTRPVSPLKRSESPEKKNATLPSPKKKKVSVVPEKTPPSPKKDKMASVMMPSSPKKEKIASEMTPSSPKKKKEVVPNEIKDNQAPASPKKRKDAITPVPEKGEDVKVRGEKAGSVLPPPSPDKGELWTDDILLAGSYVDDMNLSYETEIDDDEPPVPATDKKKVAKVRKTKKPAKLEKPGKKKQKLKVKMNAMVAAAAKLAKRKHCLPCARSFRDNWDFKKHCLTKNHELMVAKKESESESVVVEKHDKCEEYGCLICANQGHEAKVTEESSPVKS